MNRIFYAYALLAALSAAIIFNIITRDNTFEDVDYMAFYSAGEIVNNGNISHLYDFTYQLQVVENIRSFNNIKPTGITMVIFINPPAYALLMSPLAKLPYLISLNIWRILWLLVYILSAFLLVKDLNLRLKWYHIAVIGLVSCPALFAFKLGQNSFISLGIYTAIYLLLKRKKDIPAGLLLSIGLLKPQLFWCLPIVLLMMKKWKAFLGFVFGSGIFIAINYFYFGKPVILNYIHIFTSDTYRKIWTPLQIGMHSIPSFINVAFGMPTFIVAFITAILVLCMIYRAVLQNRSFDSVYAMTLLGTVLASPHLFHYDVLILFIPCLIMFKSRGFEKHILLLFGLLWLGILVPILQLSVVMIAIMFYIIYSHHDMDQIQIDSLT